MSGGSGSQPTGSPEPALRRPMRITDSYRPRAGELPAREEIPARYTWDLSSICADWDSWSETYAKLEVAISAFTNFRVTLASGPDALLAAFTAMDAMGALSYRVWYYASLYYDQDQRSNEIKLHGRRRQ